MVVEFCVSVEVFRRLFLYDLDEFCFQCQLILFSLLICNPYELILHVITQNNQKPILLHVNMHVFPAIMVQPNCDVFVW